MNKRDIRIWFVSLFIIAILAPSYFAQESFCASKAEALSECGSGPFFESFARHAIWLPFIEEGTIAFEADAFIFEGSCNGMLSTEANGMAQLTGNVVNDVDPGKGFVVDINFTGFTDTIPPDPPPNDSPKLECNPSHNFDDWVYYTGYTGTLTGTGAYAGYVISVERLGPSFQIGDGASNKNLNFGASGWFSWTIEQSPQNPTIVLRSSADIPQTLWNTLGIDSLIRGDFNINLVPKGSIGDTVFCDLNDDGIQDPVDDPGIAGVKVTLDCDNGHTDEDITGSDGTYLFSDVPAGKCTVKLDPATVPADKSPGTNCPTKVDVELAAGESFLDADFCFIVCSDCEGKVTELTLQYNGTEAAFIEVVQKKPETTVFSGDVLPGETFSFVGVDKKDTLGTEIRIFTNDLLNTKIHTSCSKPIGPGLVSGDFEVISGSSRNGGPLCPLEVPPDGGCADCEGKVTQLTLKYLGTDPGLIQVEQKKPEEIVFEAEVLPGETFTFNGIDDKGQH